MAECEGCAMYEERMNLLLGDLTNLQRDLRSKNREISRLENRNKREDERDASNATVTELLEHWRQVTADALDGTARKGRLRASIHLSGDRAAKVREVLKRHAPEKLRLACVGVTRDAFMMGANDRGRRYDDISHIFKNDERIEEFVELAVSPPKHFIRQLERAAEVLKGEGFSVTEVTVPFSNVVDELHVYGCPTCVELGGHTQIKVEPGRPGLLARCTRGCKGIMDWIERTYEAGYAGYTPPPAAVRVQHPNRSSTRITVRS